MLAQLGSRTTMGVSACSCGSKRIQHTQQIAFGAIEHAEVVQRPSTTQMALRYLHLKARVIQDLPRGLRGLRMEIVVPCIGPQQDSGKGSAQLVCFGTCGRVPRTQAALKTLRRKGWNRPLRRNADDGLHDVSHESAVVPGRLAMRGMAEARCAHRSIMPNA